VKDFTKKSQKEVLKFAKEGYNINKEIEKKREKR
jgi:hypothetical protein